MAGSASLRDKALIITLVHTHVTEPLEVRFKLAGGARIVDPSGTVLTHKQLSAANTFETPREVIPDSLAIPAQETGNVLAVQLPPASVIKLRINLA